MTSRTVAATPAVDDLPCGTEILVNQVAGHTFQSGTDEIGELKHIVVEMGRPENYLAVEIKRRRN